MGIGEEVDFLRDRAAEVVKGFAEVGGVVIGFVRILRSIKCKGLSADPKSILLAERDRVVDL